MDFVAWLSQASCMDPALPCCYLSTFYCSRTDVHSPVLLAVIYTHRIVARDVDSYHRKATASGSRLSLKKGHGEGTWCHAEPHREATKTREGEGWAEAFLMVSVDKQARTGNSTGLLGSRHHQVAYGLPW